MEEASETFDGHVERESATPIPCQFANETDRVRSVRVSAGDRDETGRNES
jgi:hypothetical protein